jgi:hypothetical protein
MRPLLLALALGLPLAAAGCGTHDATAQAQDHRVYECPMHCKLPGHPEPYTHVGPGDCPVCGMHLVPREQPAH